MHTTSHHLFNRVWACLLTAALVWCFPLSAQQDNAGSAGEGVQQLDNAAGGIEQRLIDSEAELSTLREQITREKAPLNAELRALQEELAQVSRELEKVSKEAVVQALEAEKLDATIEEREKAARFIANRLDEYIREFEAGLHIAELQQFEQVLEPAKLAMENRDLASRDRFGVQQDAIAASIDRLEALGGGVMYSGSAIDGAGVLGTRGAIVAGQFIQFGPLVVFSDTTGKLQGIVVQKIGALDPEVIPFNNPMHASLVKSLAEKGEGELPFDATLGEAIVVEQIEEGTLRDEFELGGPVMYPLLGLAVAAILIGLYKWLAITLTPKPSRKRLAELLHAVSERNIEKSRRVAKSIRGPAGRMLQAGADHLGAPRELIEEVMYEKVLTTRLKVQRLLPFIAICAAAAPLLGLLGTVSGIINTFKMMQVSGASDMQNVSGGISEALITTKFGLIVAIPALLLHVFLSRKARGVVDQMEKAGVAFINEIMKAPPPGGQRDAAAIAPSPDDDTPPTDPEDAPTPAGGTDLGDANDASSDDEGSADASGEDQQDPAEEPDKQPVLAESSFGEDVGGQAVRSSR